MKNTSQKDDAGSAQSTARAEYRGVSAEAWKRLCDSTELLRRLNAWGRIGFDKSFGIGIPGTDQVAFVSLMGADDEGQACFAYLGWEPFVHIRERIETKSLAITDLLETSALQLTFMPVDKLSEEDQGVLECAGIKITAPALAPVFRSHRTGFLPWLLTAVEVERFTEILRQTAGVVMRYESQPELLDPPSPDVVWIRRQDASGDWQEAWHPIPPASTFNQPAALDAEKLARVAALPCQPKRVQFDLALSRATVGEQGDRLQTTYLLAAFDSQSGTCIGADVILPTKGFAAMWRSVPDRLLSLCLHAKSRPREIEVGSEQMMATLRPLLRHLPIKLTLRLRLNHFQAFLDGMHSRKTSQES